jgi:hypothetical protein
MRIGILNLPLDNNYGGNLQRYALMKTLESMGHTPVHFCVKHQFNDSTIHCALVRLKWILKSKILGNKIPFYDIKKKKIDYFASLEEIMPFYNKYIRHIDCAKGYDDIKKEDKLDAYIVGSDQVWRKYGDGAFLKTMFFDFLKGTSIKRIAYSASFGSDDLTLDKNEVSKLGQLYTQFDAVSVREFGALDLLKQYGWSYPTAIQLLDPTFLLLKSDYEALISCVDTVSNGNGLFAYILDPNEEKGIIVDKYKSIYQFDSYTIGLNNHNKCSIEQWLRCFKDARLVVTDSFHGMAFSIIFNKPFVVIPNKSRGASRFETLMKIFNLSEVNLTPDWVTINHILQQERKRGISFLKQVLIC